MEWTVSLFWSISYQAVVGIQGGHVDSCLRTWSAATQHHCLIQLQGYQRSSKLWPTHQEKFSCRWRAVYRSSCIGPVSDPVRHVQHLLLLPLVSSAVFTCPCLTQPMEVVSMSMGQEGEQHILSASRPAINCQTPKISNRYYSASDHHGSDSSERTVPRCARLYCTNLRIVRMRLFL